MPESVTDNAASGNQAVGRESAGSRALQCCGLSLSVLLLCFSFGYWIQPAIEAAIPPALRPEQLLREDVARVTGEGVVWAALALVALISGVAATIQGYVSISCSCVVASIAPTLARDIRLVPVLVGLIALLAGIVEPYGLTGDTSALYSAGWVSAEMWYFTIFGNTIAAVAASSLLTASFSIMIAARTKGVQADKLAEQLKGLLLVGAIATAAAVVEINAIWRFTTAPCSDRVWTSKALDDLSRTIGEGLAHDIRGADEKGLELITPDLLAKLGAPSLGTVADKTIALRLRDVLRQADEPAKPDRIERLAREITAHLNASRQRAVAASLASLSAQLATFWGLAFSAVLTLVYLTAATSIWTESPDEKKNLALLASPGSEFRRSALRLLTALAPLLVGLAQQLTTALTSMGAE